MTLKFYTLCLSLILLLGSCGEWKDISISRVDHFNIQKMSLQEIDGELMLTIKNPNKMGFSIYRSEFDIFYGGVKLGTAKLHKRVHIGANTEKTYTFKLKSKPENLNLTDILKLLVNASSGKIQITGNLKAGKLFIRKAFPVDYSERIQLQK